MSSNEFLRANICHKIDGYLMHDQGKTLHARFAAAKAELKQHLLNDIALLDAIDLPDFVKSKATGFRR